MTSEDFVKTYYPDARIVQHPIYLCEYLVLYNSLRFENIVEATGRFQTDVTKSKADQLLEVWSMLEQTIKLKIKFDKQQTKDINKWTKV